MANDTDFLKKRVAASAQPKVDNSGPASKLADSADAFLSDVTADEDIKLKDKEYNAMLRLAKLRKRAEAADANDKEKAAADEEKASREAALEEEEANREKQPALSGVRVSQAVGAVGDSFNPVLDKVGSLPTIGGIGLMIAILVILLFTVVRVNPQGDTRMKQLWYMLNGRATIKGRVAVQKGSSFGSSFDPTKTYPSSTSGSDLGGTPGFGGPGTSFRSTADLGF